MSWKQKRLFEMSCNIAIRKAQCICIIMQENYRMFDSKIKLIPLFFTSVSMRNLVSSFSDFENKDHRSIKAQ